MLIQSTLYIQLELNNLANQKISSIFHYERMPDVSIASVLWAKLIKIAKKCSFRNYLIQFYCLSPHLIDVKASSWKKDSIAVQLMFFQSMAPLNKITIYKSHGDPDPYSK